VTPTYLSLATVATITGRQFWTCRRHVDAGLLRPDALRLRRGVRDPLFLVATAHRWDALFRAHPGLLKSQTSAVNAKVARAAKAGQAVKVEPRPAVEWGPLPIFWTREQVAASSGASLQKVRVQMRLGYLVADAHHVTARGLAPLFSEKTASRWCLTHRSITRELHALNGSQFRERAEARAARPALTRLLDQARDRQGVTK